MSVIARDELAGSVQELHEISVSHRPESGRCRCMDCAEFAEAATGHHQVLEMLAHAAMHAAATGHRVREHSELDSVVGPRGGAGVLHAA